MLRKIVDGFTDIFHSFRKQVRQLLTIGVIITLIKDLKLKGSSTVLKRGTMIKGIHLTDNADEIEGRTDKVKGLVLRTEFLKKA
jgi:protein PhnA